MKIVYYNLQFDAYDGSNAHAMGLLKALREEYGEKNVVAVGGNPGGTNTEYKHERAKIKEMLSFMLKPVRKMRRNMISKKMFQVIVDVIEGMEFVPDVILARTVLYDETPLMLAGHFGCKLVLEHNAPLVHEVCNIKKLESVRKVRSFESRILGRADGIYVVSDEIADILTEEYGADMPDISAKLKAIYNGYDKDLYNAGLTASRDDVRVRENAADKKIVTFVGSLQRWHGIDNLLGAAELLKEEDKYRFWVIGDGSEREKIREYEAANSNLKWFGNVKPEKMAELLAASDLGIMPYHRMDRFYFSPLKMYDMIGAGLPFIGLNIGQINRVADRDLSPYFVLDDCTPEILAEGIRERAENREIYDAMKESVLSIRDKYTWNKTAESLGDLFDGGDNN